MNGESTSPDFRQRLPPVCDELWPKLDLFGEVCQHEQAKGPSAAIVALPVNANVAGTAGVDPSASFPPKQLGVYSAIPIGL